MRGAIRFLHPKSDFPKKFLDEIGTDYGKGVMNKRSVTQTGWSVSKESAVPNLPSLGQTKHCPQARFEMFIALLMIKTFDSPI